MEDIKISVIMPVYNVANFLQKSIESVLHQNFRKFELILVDDGSTDGSLDILRKYESDIRVRVIHKKNSGSGLSRNRGLDIAKGEYVYFMDPDDWLEGEMLSDSYELIKSNQPDIILFGYYNHNGNDMTSENLENEFYSTKSEFILNFPKLFRKNIMYTVWNKLYNRKFLQSFDLKFGSEKNGQDYLFNLRVYDHVKTMEINNRKYYHYVIKRSNSATTKFYLDTFDLYKNEQLHLINFIEKNKIKGEDIINDRWYFILNNTWQRSLNHLNFEEVNSYMDNIVSEYERNDYIKIRYLSKFKSKVKYLLLFKFHLYKFYNKIIVRNN